ncbi:Asp-tRNA(Asn)/Glu-tRNA(Gln) amidotransferase subunit GatA [Acidobacteriota bacterium]
MNLAQHSLVEISRLIARKEIEAEEVTRSFLRSIEEKDNDVSAYITVLGERALDKAREIDRKTKKGRLAGIPIAVKDNIVIEGIKTTCGSRMMADYRPPYTASVIRLLEEEDAVIIGKTNMDEFAMGSSTENSAFFPTRNPWDLNRVPGGSSGGSAAAVAASEAVASLGTDTGGSIRQPAAYCGLVGLKPTYGRVSRYGLVAFASSLDTIGPLTRDVSDCALLTEIISGYDPKDSTSSRKPVPSFTEEYNNDIKPIRVGYLGEHKLAGIKPEVRQRYRDVLEILTGCGIEIVEMEFPSWEFALQCYYVIAPCEASSNLSRYDGVRFGFRSTRSSSLEDMYFDSRTEGFGEEVKRRILLGTFALSSGYRDAYYLKASGVRELIRREMQTAFRTVDFILTPTTSEEAFRLGEKADPMAMYSCDQFTVVANLAGIPALSIPMGWSCSGLPLGLQILGNYFQECTLFKLAFLLEKNVKFSKPNL